MMPPTRRHFIQALAGIALPTIPASLRARSHPPAPRLNFAAADRYITATRGMAFVVTHQGRVIHESYPNGGGRGDARRIYSGTKGYWGVAAMAAVEDGLLTLGEKVSATLPEWQGEKKNITVEQLLDFTCGLERGLILHQDGLKNRNQMALARPLVSSPGRSFIYGPSPLQVFHEVVKRKLAARSKSESPTKYLERRVLRPLGLGPQRYIPDSQGNPLLAAGFYQTAQQWARMGHLLLAQGAPVLKPASMGPLLKGSSANNAYSFGFWNNRASGKLGAREIDIEDMLDVDWQRQSWGRACIAKNVPKDLLACIGSSHQRLYAIPSMGLVIVRQGLNSSFSDGPFLRTLLG